MGFEPGPGETPPGVTGADFSAAAGFSPPVPATERPSAVPVVQEAAKQTPHFDAKLNAILDKWGIEDPADRADKFGRLKAAFERTKNRSTEENAQLGSDDPDIKAYHLLAGEGAVQDYLDDERAAAEPPIPAPAVPPTVVRPDATVQQPSPANAPASAPARAAATQAGTRELRANTPEELLEMNPQELLERRSQQLQVLGSTVERELQDVQRLLGEIGKQRARLDEESALYDTQPTRAVSRQEAAKGKAIPVPVEAPQVKAIQIELDEINRQLGVVTARLRDAKDHQEPVKFGKPKTVEGSLDKLAKSLGLNTPCDFSGLPEAERPQFTGNWREFYDRLAAVDLAVQDSNTPERIRELARMAGIPDALDPAREVQTWIRSKDYRSYRGEAIKYRKDDNERQRLLVEQNKKVTELAAAKDKASKGKEREAKYKKLKEDEDVLVQKQAVLTLMQRVVTGLQSEFRNRPDTQEKNVGGLLNLATSSREYFEDYENTLINAGIDPKKLKKPEEQDPESELYEISKTYHDLLSNAAARETELLNTVDLPHLLLARMGKKPVEHLVDLQRLLDAVTRGTVPAGVTSENSLELRLIQAASGAETVAAETPVEENTIGIVKGRFAKAKETDPQLKEKPVTQDMQAAAQSVGAVTERQAGDIIAGEQMMYGWMSKIPDKERKNAGRELQRLAGMTREQRQEEYKKSKLPGHNPIHEVMRVLEALGFTEKEMVGKIIELTKGDSPIGKGLLALIMALQMIQPVFQDETVAQQAGHAGN